MLTGGADPAALRVFSNKPVAAGLLNVALLK